MTPLQVRFLTWNVHGCVGRDRVCDLDRVARVLEAAQPDISALQEIDSRTTKVARDPFSYFGQLFGWTSVAARTLAARDGHYGHAVPAADVDARARDLSVAPASAAPRPDLVQRPARADDDRDAARRRSRLGPSAAAREHVLAVQGTKRWHGVCLMEAENSNAGRPNG